jgi:hypothetical protein
LGCCSQLIQLVQHATTSGVMSRETGKPKGTDFSNDSARKNSNAKLVGDRWELTGANNRSFAQLQIFEFPLPILVALIYANKSFPQREVEKEGIEARDTKIGEVLFEEIKRRGDVRTPYW